MTQSKHFLKLIIACPRVWILLFIFAVLSAGQAQGATTTLARVRGELVLTDFGAVGDGVTDDTLAFQRAVAAVPGGDTTWFAPVPFARVANSYTIFIPTPKVAYRITQPIVLPDRKSISFIGAGPMGPRIFLDGPSTAIFYVKSGRRALLFENLTFHHGGVQFAGNVMGWYGFRNDQFAETPGFAIETLGPSVYPVEVSNTLFTNCAGAISIGYLNSDLWVISHNQFWRNSSTDIVVNSTGVTISENDFEIREGGDVGSPHPYINIASTGIPTGLIDIVRNRFGNEAGESGPPRDAIIIGDPNNVSARTSNSIRILYNYFMGTNGQMSDISAASAIRLNMRVERTLILGNDFRAYYSSLVSEDYLNATPRVAGALNKWRDNTILPNCKTPSFSRGGVGFGS